MMILYNATIAVEPHIGQGGRGDVFGDPFTMRCRLVEKIQSSTRDDKRSAPTAQAAITSRWELTYRRGEKGLGTDSETAGISAGSKITLPDGSTVTCLRTVPQYAQSQRPWSYRTIAR